MLLEGKIDFLALTQTKLNSSFLTSQFAVENDVISRLDRPNNLGGGEILCYINSSIPTRMQADLACNQDGIESMVIEFTVKQERWFFVVLYRPPNVSVNYLKSAMAYTSHKCLEQVILTNVPKRVRSILNTDICVSDFHNLTLASTKLCIASNAHKEIVYRSYKHFDRSNFLKELTEAPLHVSLVFDDCDDQLWFHNALVEQIFDENAPIKNAKLKHCHIYEW